MRYEIVLGLVLASPLCIGALTVRPSRAQAEGTGAAPTGVEVFTTFKCNSCHSIESQGIESKTKSERMKGPDLSDEGHKRDAAWITAWLQHKEKLDGKAHKGEFKGTDEQLQQLVQWLTELKKT